MNMISGKRLKEKMADILMSVQTMRNVKELQLQL